MNIKSAFAIYEPITGLLTFSVEKLTPEQLEALEKAKDKQLDLSISVHRKKRSLDSNSYMWALLSKIAQVLNTSKDEVYEECLQKYGYLDEEIIITVKSDVDMSRIDGHWRFIRANGKFKGYIMIRGTSTYNTAEMSHFLDMVVQEAKDLGIETATPEQLAEMKRLYEQRYGEPQG